MYKLHPNLIKYIDRDRCAELEAYLLRMQERALADAGRLKYNDEADAALHRRVMYFQPILCTPCDRREVARTIVANPAISESDKVLNIMLTYMYGPTWTYLYLTGKTDPMLAHVLFDWVAKDPDYVQEIRENIAYARLHGHSMWTTTELHTSLQTEARNYVRKRYNQPDRKADSLDLIEWLASFKKAGVIDKIVKAKTLEEGYDALTSVRGIGPYFGWNSIAMIANCSFVPYTHDELFCAPGGGAISTLEYLFEPLREAGHSLRHGPLISWLRLHQRELFPNLYIDTIFQNMDTSYGKLLREDQTEYTTNSFEVGCCQFSVYRKFKENPVLIDRRLNPPPINLEPFKAREAGNPIMIEKGSKRAAESTIDTKTTLLSFD